MVMTEGKGVRRCHWGSKFAFQWEGLNFFGGGSFRGMDTIGMDVIIDCGANIQQNAEYSTTSTPGEQRLIRTIRWPDGGVPDLTEKDWKDLLGDIVRLSRDRKTNLNVLVCCVGGHGRTGTTLAIFAALTGIAPADPVVYTRTAYCPKAVETKVQCRYIRSITKRDTEEADTSCESGLR